MTNTDTMEYSEYSDMISNLPDTISRYSLQEALDMEGWINEDIGNNRNNTKFFDVWYATQMRLIELGEER